MKLATAHWLYKVLMTLAILTGILVPVLGYSTLATTLLVLCILFFVGGFLTLTRCHRCPHCKEVVSPKGKLPKTCPECGKPLGEVKE